MSTIKQTKGFTMIELVVAMALGAMLAFMLGGIGLAGVKNLSAILRRNRLDANAVFLTENLSYMIKQGVIVTVPSSSTLQITFPGVPTSSVMSISKSGTTIVSTSTLNPAVTNLLTTSDVQVTQLSFTQLARSVRISFSLKATPTSSPETLSATTTVALRNSP